MRQMRPQRSSVSLISPCRLRSDTLEGISLMTQATPTVVTSDPQCKIGDKSSMTGTPLAGKCVNGRVRPFELRGMIADSFFALQSRV